MVLVTVQAKLAEPAKEASSVAVTVTDEVPLVVGVPLMAPVELSMESPAGRPVADQLRMAVDEESFPAMASGAMAEPDVAVWAPGLVTVTTLVMVQEKLAESLAPLPSAAVTVTDEVPAVVGVPLMAPVELLMARPAGRPEAVQVKVAPDSVSEAELDSVAMAEPETSV